MLSVVRFSATARLLRNCRFYALSQATISRNEHRFYSSQPLDVQKKTSIFSYKSYWKLFKETFKSEYKRPRKSTDYLLYFISLTISITIALVYSVFVYHKWAIQVMDNLTSLIREKLDALEKEEFEPEEKKKIRYEINVFLDLYKELWFP